MNTSDCQEIRRDIGRNCLYCILYILTAHTKVISQNKVSLLWVGKYKYIKYVERDMEGKSRNRVSSMPPRDEGSLFLLLFYFLLALFKYFALH